MKSLLIFALFIFCVGCQDDAKRETPPPEDTLGASGQDTASAKDTSTEPGDAQATDTTAADADADTDAVDPPARISEDEASAQRAACAFERGAMPWQTVGDAFPIGDDIPIDHVILLMQENRSFDHYFGTMPGVDGIPDGASNPDADGVPVSAFHAEDYCIRDVSHSWNSSHRQWNDGANDGFVTTNGADGARALGYLDGADLPFYWDLYKTFAMSDHHHCSMLGPTYVNRFYYLAGTSFGLTHNTTVPEAEQTSPYMIFQLLTEAGVDWAVYQSDVPFVLGAFPRYFGQRPSRIRPLSAFYQDLADGTLPAVAYVDPSFFEGTDKTDEHPPSNPQHGQAFIEGIIEAAFASPLWPRTAIILTYDEHGGFYDHVSPPKACHPGDASPELGPNDMPGDFDQLGFRVPLAVISPYSRPGYVSKYVTDLSSILRFVEVRFSLPALTGRDANAWPLLDMFDFNATPFLTPPELDSATLDPEKEAACLQRFP